MFQKILGILKRFSKKKNSKFEENIEDILENLGNISENINGNSAKVRREF